MEAPSTAMTCYELLRDFQTVIVGIIGFAGVIITIAVNAQLSRRERREQRNHDRQTIRTALITELNIIKGSLEKSVKKTKATAVAVPTDTMDNAYRALTDKIGLLTPDEVHNVTYAYLTLQTLGSALFLIGTPIQTSPRYVKVAAKDFPSWQSLEKSTIKPITEAIETLEKAREQLEK